MKRFATLFAATLALAAFAGSASAGTLDDIGPQPGKARFRQALAQLQPRDAEILLLKYTENWNYHQIATHLGSGHAAVEARLHRARARLRMELAALDVIEVKG